MVLTDYEFQVIALLVKGKTLAEVALDLGISFGAANSRRRRAYRKISVHSRADLRQWMLEVGLASENDIVGWMLGENA